MENIISLIESIFNYYTKNIFFFVKFSNAKKKKKNIHDLIRRNITINQENIKY